MEPEFTDYKYSGGVWAKYPTDLKAIQQEARERAILNELESVIMPTEDGEFECATLPVTAPRVEELIRLEQFPDSMERAPRYDIQLPDGHLYNEVNGEDLED